MKNLFLLTFLASAVLAQLPDDPQAYRLFEGSLLNRVEQGSVSIGDLTDPEREVVYAAFFSTPVEHPWRQKVETDLLSNSSSQAVVTQLLKKPRSVGMRGGLWSWLSKHPGYDAQSELLEESIRVFRAERGALDRMALGALGDFVVARGTHEQVKSLLDELSDAGAVGIEISRARYALRLEKEKAASSRDVAPQQTDAGAPKALPSKTHLGSTSESSEEQAFSNTWWMVIGILVGSVLVWLALRVRKGDNPIRERSGPRRK